MEMKYLRLKNFLNKFCRTISNVDDGVARLHTVTENEHVAPPRCGEFWYEAVVVVVDWMYQTSLSALAGHNDAVGVPHVLEVGRLKPLHMDAVHTEIAHGGAYTAAAIHPQVCVHVVDVVRPRHAADKGDTGPDTF